MTLIPSPRLMAIAAALLRRFRDAAAKGILFAASSLALGPTLIFFIAFLFAAESSFLSGSQNPFPTLAGLVMGIGLASALAWSFLRQPAPLVGAGAAALPAPLLQRAELVCSRGLLNLFEAFFQFVGCPPLWPIDRKTPSLHDRYRARTSASGRGSIIIALAVSLEAIPFAAIFLGLLSLALMGSIGCILLAFPAHRQRQAALARNLGGDAKPSTLAAARKWAASLTDRLAAEGSADLAANEAALFDRELPASSKPAPPVKSPRL